MAYMHSDAKFARNFIGCLIIIVLLAASGFGAIIAHVLWH